MAVVKMAQNGQVVIPAKIRKEAGLKPAESFIVYYDGSQIMLKPINEKNLSKDLDLIEKIRKAETEIRSGKTVVVDSEMADKEIDELLMK